MQFSILYLNYTDPARPLFKKCPDPNLGIATYSIKLYTISIIYTNKFIINLAFDFKTFKLDFSRTNNFEFFFVLKNVKKNLIVKLFYLNRKTT